MPSDTRTVLKIGKRKPGVPSQQEMYKILKERSLELQSKIGNK